MSTWHEAPTLRGQFVLLRPLEEDDWQALAKANDSPGILEYFPYGQGSEPPSAENVAAAVRDPGRQALVQIDQRTHDVVGTTSVYFVDEAKRQLTIGYTWLSQAARGGLINTEAKLLLFRHAFETLGAVRVQLYVDDRNERSLRAVARLGAQREGELRKHARRRDGSWRSTVVFSVIDDDWPAVRTGLEAALRRLPLVVEGGEECSPGFGSPATGIVSFFRLDPDDPQRGNGPLDIAGRRANGTAPRPGLESELDRRDAGAGRNGAVIEHAVQRLDLLCRDFPVQS
ncbi:MAG: GNAT family N-acetyltransferase [Streptosporangiales bacterium]|nr:GNAT family N-acetyltransferase [Streptosporangiales bacterium]